MWKRLRDGEEPQAEAETPTDDAPQAEAETPTDDAPQAEAEPDAAEAPACGSRRRRTRGTRCGTRARTGIGAGARAAARTGIRAGLSGPARLTASRRREGQASPPSLVISQAISPLSVGQASTNQISPSPSKSTRAVSPGSPPL